MLITKITNKKCNNVSTNCVKEAHAFHVFTVKSLAGQNDECGKSFNTLSSIGTLSGHAQFLLKARTFINQMVWHH